MDFEEGNFGLPFNGVTLQKNSWQVVDLFGDDNIALKLYKNNICNCNEKSYIFINYIFFTYIYSYHWSSYAAQLSGATLSSSQL